MKRLKVQLGIGLAAALMMVACNTNWITTAQALLPVAVSMTNGVVTAVLLLENKTITPQDLQKIQDISNQVSNDLSEVQTLITAYQNSSDVTILGKINATIQAALTTENQLLTDLHVTDPATVQKITALVEIVTSEISAIEQIIPIVQNGQPVPRAVRTVTRNQSKYNPVKVKAAWNAKIDVLGLNPAAKLK